MKRAGFSHLAIALFLIAGVLYACGSGTKEERDGEGATTPNAPVVTGTTPTSDTTPTWSWISGSGGIGTFRYKLDDNDLTSRATYTVELSHTPSSPLSDGSHTLYVQERDAARNWSASGSLKITVAATVPTTSLNAPSARSDHSAVWTGTEMCVWGGWDNSALNTGACYNPITDSWRTITTTGAPSATHDSQAVWTGSKMCIWGNGGGCYDPSTDSWTSISGGINSPLGTNYFQAIWTGTEMCVWGGNAPGGGCYDPNTNSWSSMNMTNAPIARYGHTTVWTGFEMCIWGGKGSNNVSLDTGSCYSPSNNSWTVISTTYSPAPRSSAKAIWSGTEMCVWGGSNADQGYLDTGGCYNPSTDSWRTISTIGAPVGRGSHAAVWTGSKMCVWGGRTDPVTEFALTTTIGCYDPSEDTWSEIWTLNNLPALFNPSSIWTGTKWCIWGGRKTVGYSNSGACTEIID